MQLTQLQLCRVEGLTYALSVPTGHAALTSLPMLQDLELHQLLLTRTAFMLMFQEPGHVLQQLTKLQLIVPDEWQYWEPYQLSLPEVIAGCPSLRQLDVEHLLINVHDIQMLSGLSSLTSLCITPVQKSTITWLGLDVGVQALMCLTGLKALRLPSSTYLHSEELRSLTCLQQLTYLGLDCVSIAQGGPCPHLALTLQRLSRPAHASKAGDPWDDEPRWVLTNKWRADLPPVWSQVDAAYQNLPDPNTA